MKTIQVMSRPIFGDTIQQRTGDGFFLLSSISSAGDKWRRANGRPFFNTGAFVNQSAALMLASVIEAKTGAPAIEKTGRGRASKTWVHPFIMLEVAFAIAPELKFEVYGWIYDELIKYRDDSGDSYKKMCGALYGKFENKRMFGHFVADAANQIREACKVDDWNRATEQQLKLRDKIHDTVAIASDFAPDARVAFRMGLANALGSNRPKLILSSADAQKVAQPL